MLLTFQTNTVGLNPPSSGVGGSSSGHRGLLPAAPREATEALTAFAVQTPGFQEAPELFRSQWQWVRPPGALVSTWEFLQASDKERGMET